MNIIKLFSVLGYLEVVDVSHMKKKYNDQDLYKLVLMNLRDDVLICLNSGIYFSLVLQNFRNPEIGADTSDIPIHCGHCHRR